VEEHFGTVLITANRGLFQKGKLNYNSEEKMKQTLLVSIFYNCKITKAFSYCLKFQVIGFASLIIMKLVDKMCKPFQWRPLQKMGI
jgi:hypothetical protein